MKGILILAALLAGCGVKPQTPQERREDMMKRCINDGYRHASDCAAAAWIAIPEGTK
jgi:hypothetical protein